MLVTLATPVDFSLYETLHSHGWRHLKPFYPDDAAGGLSQIDSLESGEVVEISVRQSTEGELAITTDSDVGGDHAAKTVRRILQLDRSLADFHEYCLSTPNMGHIEARRQGRFLCSPTVFEDCLKVIMTTNTTWTQTKAMVTRIVEGFGDPWPADPARHAFPTPERIAAVPFDEFAAIARAGYRAKAIHALAVDVASGDVDLETLRDASLPSEDVLKRLLKIHGIGPYGAACLLLYLGRGDRVNVDSWARTLLAREIGRPVSDKQVTEYFLRYGKWRGFIYSFYPWKDRDSAASADIAA